MCKNNVYSFSGFSSRQNARLAKSIQKVSLSQTLGKGIKSTIESRPCLPAPGRQWGRQEFWFGGRGLQHRGVEDESLPVWSRNGAPEISSLTENKNTLATYSFIYCSRDTAKVPNALIATCSIHKSLVVAIVKSTDESSIFYLVDDRAHHATLSTYGRDYTRWTGP